MKKAHKIRIYPNSRQEIQFQKTFGCVRFYWNFLLDQRITNDKMKKENPEYIEKILWDYVSTLDDDAMFYKHDVIVENNWQKHLIISHGPD